MAKRILPAEQAVASNLQRGVTCDGGTSAICHLLTHTME